MLVLRVATARVLVIPSGSSTSQIETLTLMQSSNRDGYTVHCVEARFVHLIYHAWPDWVLNKGCWHVRQICQPLHYCVSTFSEVPYQLNRNLEAVGVIWCCKSFAVTITGLCTITDFP